MSTFDLCDPTGSCGQRNVTTVPTQALALLNNRFVHERSEQLAAMILAGDRSETVQIHQAWLSVLKRRASEQEVLMARQHLAVQLKSFSPDHPTLSPEAFALSSLCLVLLNSNEFIYID
jgi:hypothetical protein